MKFFKKKLLKILNQNELFKNISILAIANISSQIIVLGISPIITRIYNPKDFGILATYTGIVGILGICCTLRYELSIPILKSRKEVSYAILLSLLILSASTLFLALVFFFLGKELFNFLNLPNTEILSILLPAGLFLTGMFNIMTNYAIYEKNFKKISFSKLSNSIFTSFFQLTMFKFGGISLILGQASGFAAGVLSLSNGVFKRYFFYNLKLKFVKKFALRHKRFPLYSAPAGLIRVSREYLPILIFSKMFGLTSLGLYFLAQKILQMPLALLGDSIGKVFFANAAKAKKNGELNLLTKKFYVNLIKLSFPSILIISMIAPSLFEYVFGQSWQKSGEYARWLGPWVFVIFVSSPLTYLTTILERQKEGFIYQIFAAVLSISSIILGSKIGNFDTVIKIFAITNFVHRFLFLLWLVHLSGNTIKSIFVNIYLAFVNSLYCFLLIIIAKLFFMNNDQFLFFSVLLSLSFTIHYYYKIFKTQIL